MSAGAPPDGHACTPTPDGPRVNGVRIDPHTAVSYLARVQDFLACGRSHVVHFCSAHTTVEARRNARYREVVNRGDLNLPDGAAVAWALALYGLRARRLPGTEGLHALAGWGQARGLAHYFYGATGDVLDALVGNLRAAHPELRVAGLEAPPFRPSTDEELGESVARMRDAGTHALWVGLGTPKQDLVAERLRAMDAAPVILCVGAAFDFVAGSRARAPAWMQGAGLEWAHRLASDPVRLWRRYLLGNPTFVAGVLLDRLRGGR